MKDIIHLDQLLNRGLFHEAYIDLDSYLEPWSEEFHIYCAVIQLNLGWAELAIDTLLNLKALVLNTEMEPLVSLFLADVYFREGFTDIKKAKDLLLTHLDSDLEKVIKYYIEKNKYKEEWIFKAAAEISSVLKVNLINRNIDELVNEINYYLMKYGS